MLSVERVGGDGECIENTKHITAVRRSPRVKYIKRVLSRQIKRSVSQNTAR